MLDVLFQETIQSGQAGGGLACNGPGNLLPLGLHGEGSNLR